MVHETELAFQSEFPMNGTLCLPKVEGQYPAILILPGSGNGDRDGNVPKKKLFLNLYGELAQFFANLGFASFRYDKRGVGESGGTFLKAGMYDFVDDAEKAFEFLKSHPSIDPNRIFVFGHSEGGILAVALAQRLSPAGFLLVGTPFGGMEHSLWHQRQILYAGQRKEKSFQGFLFRKFNLAEKSERRVEKFLKRVKDSKKDVIKSLGVIPINAKWMREHFFYDIQADLSKIQCPVLAVTGSRDVQVIAEEVYKAKELCKSLTPVIVENMNHILREQTEEVPLAKLIRFYISQANQPYHPALLETLKNWLEEQM